jgi:hypothetical protein
MTTSMIPPFYRIFFTWVDPIIAASGVWLGFAAPDTMVNSLLPGGVHDHQIKFIFQQHGGGMLNIALLSAGLLRASNDLKVWNWVQGSILAVDFVGLYSIWDALRSQSRLNFGALRSEDWGCIAITGFVTVLRILFLVGVGFNKVSTGKRD